MKVTTILGSPRIKGNTAKIIGFLEESLKKEHEIQRVNIIKQKINGCLGCFKCQEQKDKRCYLPPYPDRFSFRHESPQRRIQEVCAHTLPRYL